MIKRLLLSTILFLLVACSNSEPVIVKKESSSDVFSSEPELIEPENEDIASESIEFPLENELVIINLKMVPILNEYLHASKNQEQAIKKMNLLPIHTSISTIYLLEFSCVNGLCSYLILDQSKDNQTYLIADLAKYSHSIFSPDNSKVLLMFDRKTSLSIPLTNIVVIDTDKWEQVTIDSELDDNKLLNYNWPITTAVWIDNETISISKPVIIELTDDLIDNWLDKGSPTIDLILRTNK